MKGLGSEHFDQKHNYPEGRGQLARLALPWQSPPIFSLEKRATVDLAETGGETHTTPYAAVVDGLPSIWLELRRDAYHPRPLIVNGGRPEAAPPFPDQPATDELGRRS